MALGGQQISVRGLAAEYAAPVFNVRSSIGRSDDLLSGKSYYIAEVESLLGLVEASSNPAPHLFLLDELFRGTNAVERIAARMTEMTGREVLPYSPPVRRIKRSTSCRP